MGIKNTITLVVVMILTISTCTETSRDQTRVSPSIGFDQTDYESERVDLFVPSPLILAIGLNVTDSRAFVYSTMQNLEAEIKICMSESGLAYEPHITRDDVGDTWLPNLTRIDFARKHGFGSSITIEEASFEGLVDDDPNEAFITSLDREEQDSWYEQLEGCQSTVSTTQWGTEGAIYDTILSQANREVRNHVDVRSAIDNYLACTSEAGYRWLNNPWMSRLIGSVHATMAVYSLEEEIDAALLNLECLYPFEQISRSIRFDIEMTLVDQHSEILKILTQTLLN